MKIPVPNGGGSGSGSGSDECTAVAADILEGKTAIFDGSNDEPDYGTMPNIDSIDPAKSVFLGSGILYCRMSNGAHVNNASSGYPEVSVPQDDLASAISLTAAKIATGSSVLGITGTYTGVGTATASQVLSGYTFSNSSSSGISGSMSDRSGSTTSVTATLDSSNSRVQMTIPNNGYYNTSAYLYTSYSSLASVIGLTAAKLGTGQTCLGITGTYKPTVENITAMAYRGFGMSSSDYVTEMEKSYTCSAAGTCYYGGISAFYNATGNGTCEIYKNGTLVDSRNSEGYYVRGTMVGQSVSVASGDVIKVSCTATSGTHVLTFISADIVTYT